MAADTAPRRSPPPVPPTARDWPALCAALIDEAAAPYRSSGRFAYHFARGKLGGDPLFRALLEEGLLGGRRRILDLGCGQGLLAAWLAAARHCYESGRWPRGWPPPPAPTVVRGIELKPRDVERARRSLAGSEIEQGDIRSAAFGSADAIVIVDVLHYLRAEAQREVLTRARAALPAGGRLLLRVGDAAGGARFRITLSLDRLIMLARGHGLITLHCRTLAEWQTLLAACGFESKGMPMSRGTPFANVLLIGTAR